MKEKIGFDALIDKIADCVERLQKKKDLTKLEKLKRKNRYYNKDKKLSYNKNRCSMKPEIDTTKPMPEIVEDLKELKGIKQWTDEDGRERYLKGEGRRYKIITKVKIKEIIKAWNQTLRYKAITKKFKLGYRKAKRIIKII